MEWKIYKNSLNICSFYNQETETRVTLEYDYNIGGFRELSDYTMCKNYLYKNRLYNRDSYGNRQRYYRILSTIPVDVYKKQIANKKFHGFLYISKLIIHKFLHKNS